MDLNEIKNSNLRAKSKEEIIAFLGNALSSFDLAVDYEMLKQFISPEQLALIDAALEKDTRDDIQINNPEIEESEIPEWIKSDKAGRPLGLKTRENKDLVITDPTSKTQETPEICDINLDTFKLSTFVELVRQGIKHKQTHVAYGEKLDSSHELRTLEDELQLLSDSLRDLSSIKKRSAAGDKSENLLLEVLRLSHMGISVNDLEPLVNSNAAAMAKTLRMADAEQRFKPNADFTPESVEAIKKGYVERGIYTVSINNSNMFQLYSMSSFLPNLDFDSDKMNSPEFSETLLKIIEKNQDKLINSSSGFILEELEEIVKNTLSPREQNKDSNNPAISRAATTFARDPEVIKESTAAELAFETLQNDKTKTFEEDQFNIDK